MGTKRIYLMRRHVLTRVWPAYLFLSVAYALDVSTQSTHTTNFALLVQRYPVTNNIALNAFGYICCTISTLSVLALLVIYLYFKKLRGSMLNQLHIHQCLSLFIAYLTFISGALRNNQSRTSCTATAFILQVSLLSSWGWMVVENFVLYRKFITVFNVFGDHFIRNSAIIVYVTSLITSSITLAASEIAIKNKLGGCFMSGPDDFPSYYISGNLCWLKGSSLYFGFLLPVFLMLLGNIITFVAVSNKLAGKNCKIRSSKEKQDGKKSAIRLFAIAALLGVTWIFAVPSLFTDDEKANIAFSWLFSLANALQGFILFYLFAVRREEVYDLWWKHYKSFRSSRLTSETQSTSAGRELNSYSVFTSATVHMSQNSGKQEVNVDDNEGKKVKQDQDGDKLDIVENQPHDGEPVAT